MRMLSLLLCFLAIYSAQAAANPADFLNRQTEKSLRAYLDREAARILKEGDRVRLEADRLQSEAERLRGESTRLLEGAKRLDNRWLVAMHGDPDRYRDFNGRDNSQRRMRLDAQRIEKDIGLLQRDSNALTKEAARLWELAKAVDPDAQKDLLERMRCCMQAGLPMLRAKIVQLAQDLGVSYRPQ